MNKNLASIILALAALPLSAQETIHSFESGNVYYRIIEGTNTVEACGFSPDAVDVIIPESVQYPGADNAVFYKVVGFTGNDTPDIETKGARPNIKSLKLPSTIKYIGNYAFSKYDLEELIIPATDSDLEIKRDTYSGMNKLKRFILEDCEHELKYYEISKDPLEAASSQNRLWLNLNFPSLEEIYMGRQFDYITMHDNPNIVQFTIGKKVGHLDMSMMRNCEKLKSVTIPDNVHRIGSRAFKNCKSLETVFIGSNLSEFADQYPYSGGYEEGEGAFDGCSSLKYIECAAYYDVWWLTYHIPRGSKWTFRGVPVDVCELVVPIEHVDLYKLSECWGVFKNIRGKDFSQVGIDEATDGNSEPEISFDGGVLTSEKDGLSIAVYSVDGRCVASRTLAQGESLELPSRGIYIVIADGKTKKIVY